MGVQVRLHSVDRVLAWALQLGLLPQVGIITGMICTKGVGDGRETFYH